MTVKGAGSSISKEEPKPRRMMAAQNDPNVYKIAQLVFGLNSKCIKSGVMLDDEGVYGTADIG